MQETVEMSKKELDKYSILEQLLQKQLKQKKAAELLKLSDRQVRNLLCVYKKYGPKGLVSKQRGKKSNRSYSEKYKARILAIIAEKYPDFGPSFAREKLMQYHNITISIETLRKWMIEKHLWIPRKSKPRLHPMRPRREYFGELIQADASHHLWFEDRAEKCALIVFIDDATSRLTSLHFCPVECLQGYFTALNNHLIKYGKPRGLYTDRHAIFGGAECIQNAQFVRALKELDIQSVLARSPQAKGRVERVNQTLQDRLVKEMRLRNISSIEDANKYIEEFIEEFNKKFSKEPRGHFDAHRPLDSGIDLERILARCEVRTLSKDLSFSYHNKYYRILEPQMINRLRRKKVEVREKQDRTMVVLYEGKELRFIPAEEDVSDHQIIDHKDKLVWEPGRGGHPKKNHPWKKYSYQIALENKIKQLESMV
jgi:hypothetical protein